MLEGSDGAQFPLNKTLAALGIGTMKAPASDPLRGDKIIDLLQLPFGILTAYREMKYDLHNLKIIHVYPHLEEDYHANFRSLSAHT